MKRPTRRVAMRLAYDGSVFRGFQRQPGQPTVEGALVHALEAIGLSGGLGFASRTDAGVHARGQVVVFRVPFDTALEALNARLAGVLAAGVSIEALAWAPQSFHPRWSANGKIYEYRLAREAGAARAWVVDVEPARLEAALDALRQAPALDGFTAAGAPDKPAPPLAAIRSRAEGGVLTLEVEGPAFRRYAIRHMLGCAVAEARGEVPEGTCAVQAASRPPYRGLRAPADGLTLVRVLYPPGLDPFAS